MSEVISGGRGASGQGAADRERIAWEDTASATRLGPKKLGLALGSAGQGRPASAPGMARLISETPHRGAFFGPVRILSLRYILGPDRSAPTPMRPRRYANQYPRGSVPGPHPSGTMAVWRVRVPTPCILVILGGLALCLGATLLITAGGCAPGSAARPLVPGESALGRYIDLTHAFDEQTVYWPTEGGFKLIKGVRRSHRGGLLLCRASLRGRRARRDSHRCPHPLLRGRGTA